MQGTIPSESIAGAPTIDFVFSDSECTAHLAGIMLTATTQGDPDTDDARALMVITDDDGKCLANLLVGKREKDDNLTSAVVDIGSAFLWSAWRFREAKKDADSHGPIIDRAHRALVLIGQHGGSDGADHKAWVIDQVTRELAGDQYDNFVAAAKAGEDGPDTYEWDIGIAP